MLNIYCMVNGEKILVGQCDTMDRANDIINETRQELNTALRIVPVTKYMVQDLDGDQYGDEFETETDALKFIEDRKERYSNLEFSIDTL